jgi:hypothetical protein
VWWVTCESFCCYDVQSTNQVSFLRMFGALPQGKM